MIKRTSLLGLAFLAIACSSAHKNLNTDVGTMAEGDRLAKSEFFDEARRQFFRIKTKFPKSNLQVEANLKIEKSYYDKKSYTPAATAYEKFIKPYPGRPEIPEALFSLGF